MLKITVDDKELQEFFKKLQGKLNDLEPAFKIAGQIIVRSVQRNFEVGGRYSEVGSWRGGTNKWKPLSPATIKARQKEPYAKGTDVLVRLGLRGGLMGSITYRATKDGVEVGTDRPYGPIHQFGGEAGRKHAAKIPARPFLIVQDEDIEEIKKTILEYLAEK